MDDKKMVDDLVKMLDSGMAMGVGRKCGLRRVKRRVKKCSDHGLYGLLQNPSGMQRTYPGGRFGRFSLMKRR